MINIDTFWEVPGFWQMVFVLTMFAAMATLCICFGPEMPDRDDDSEDQP